MSRHLDMVAEFHRVFHLSTAFEPDLGDQGTADARLNLIMEEWIELRDALFAGDVVEAADAIADLLYQTYGAALEFGIPIDDVFDEVHRSNMTKVWSDEEIANIPEYVTGISRVIRVGPTTSIVHSTTGKVIKPPSFTPPNLGPILIQHLHRDEGRFERQG